MADTLYLSLWYPNLRLEALPDKLTAVLGAFAAHGGEIRVYAATVWPVSWSEPPVFQQVWGRRITVGGEGETQIGAEPAAAVEAATELLHEDYAYEFQIGWNLWEFETESGNAGPLRQAQGRLSTALRFAQDERNVGEEAGKDRSGELARASARSQVGKLAEAQVGKFAEGAKTTGRWARGSRLVRVTGYGPLFDEGAYELDGHIRVDLGPDGPFLEEDVPLDQVGARHVEENVRQLVGLAGAVEKASGATARLLWSELGESLAQRLAARLGVSN